MLATVLNPRKRSLLRGTVLVLASLTAAFVLSDFPRNRANVFISIPAVLAFAGTYDTTRCMQRRWNMYHAGVILLIYMDLMAIFMILFLLLYPFWL